MIIPLYFIVLNYKKVIGKYLKQFRETLQDVDKEKYSLRAVAERWGKANSYLSDIENEKIKNPDDEQIIQLLIKGFGLTHIKSKDKLSQWKTLEALKIANNKDAVYKNVGQIINGNVETINQTFN